MSKFYQHLTARVLYDTPNLKGQSLVDTKWLPADKRTLGDCFEDILTYVDSIALQQLGDICLSGPTTMPFRHTLGSDDNGSTNLHWKAASSGDFLAKQQDGNGFVYYKSSHQPWNGNDPYPLYEV